MSDNDAPTPAELWNVHESLRHLRRELERHERANAASLRALLQRAGGRVEFTDADGRQRTLVLRQPPREYDAVRLDALCVRWRNEGWGPLAQQVRLCQTVEVEAVVEEERL